MPTYKVDFIFNSERQGWDESFYTTVSSSDLAIANAITVGQARIKLLGNQNQIDAIRVSDVDILGDSVVDESLSNQNDRIDAATARDLVAVSVLGRATALNKYRRQIWVRGIPDKFTEFDPATGKSKLRETAAFLTPWNAWVAQVIGKGYQLRVINKDTPFKPVTGVLVNPRNGQTVIRAPGHGYAAGTMIRIKGCKFANKPGDTLDENGKSLVNGVWQVRDVEQPALPAPPFPPADWFEIPSLFGDVVPAYVSGGKAQARIPTYVPIDFMTYSRSAKRDTGRAFFVPRGRARGRRRIPQ